MEMNESDFVFELIESGVAEDDLFVSLGDNVSIDLGFGEEPVAARREAGMSWWAENAGNIRRIVCRVASDKEGSSAFIKDLVQITFVLLGAKYGMAIASYAAAIAVKKVLAGWCDIEYERNPSAV